MAVLSSEREDCAAQSTTVVKQGVGASQTYLLSMFIYPICSTASVPFGRKAPIIFRVERI